MLSEAWHQATLLHLDPVVIMRMLYLPLMLSVVLIASCQSPVPSVETQDEQAVIETLAGLADQFSQAYMAGDIAAMMDLYTEDAVIFPSNSEYIQGMEALRKYWTLPEGRRITHHKLMPVEVEVSGTMASDFGHYEISGVNGDQAWGPVQGKYLVVWKQGTDGQWRMHLDMWNSRAPQEN